MNCPLCHIEMIEAPWRDPRDDVLHRHWWHPNIENGCKLSGQSKPAPDWQEAGNEQSSDNKP